MRAVRDSKTAKMIGLPVQRFVFECACLKGTDDPREFEEHLIDCKAVLDGVRELIAVKYITGEPIAVQPDKTVKERPGQEAWPWR